MPEPSMEAATTPTEFDPEQKRYLEGFMSGLQIARAARAVPASANGAGGIAAPAAEPMGPDADHLRAQDRFVKEGKKLSDPEKFKRELHPFDGYERLKAQAANNEPPKADDNFRWRFYGLFYCAPNQAAYMCRLRIPNGILKQWQFALELLRIGKLLAFFDEAILCAQMSNVSSHGLGRGRAVSTITRRRASRARDLQSRHEAFQIALLFGIEFAGCRL